LLPRPRRGHVRFSSNGAVSGGSSRPPQTAGFVEEQQSRPVLLLVVRSERIGPPTGDARYRAADRRLAIAQCESPAQHLAVRS
jgi:hypothetical protein